jgi:hypothetical protein
MFFLLSFPYIYNIYITFLIKGKHIKQYRSGVGGRKSVSSYEQQLYEEGSEIRISNPCGVRIRIYIYQ